MALKILYKYSFYFILIVLLVIWEVSVHLLSIPIYILPPPSGVFLTIYNNIGILFKDTLVTGFEAVLGFCLGSIVGFMLALLFVLSRLLARIAFPYFIAFQTIPIIAIAPLLVVWFGNGFLGKIIMASFICVFPIVVNTTKGLRSVDSNMLDLFKINNATRIEILLKLRIPTSLPFFFSALKISIVFSVIGAIVAEMVGAKLGLGFRIIISSYRLDTEMMFSAIIFSSLLGLFLSYLIRKIESRMIVW
jgi:NitT/TauT family transport system permease protein